MKKLAAIFLLVIFLFNIGGYRLWFYFSQKQAEKELQASLDNNQYNENELITLKVPLSLPYQNDSHEFERVNGEINYKGKIYTYVKRKIENGECVLLCLPDKTKMQIENAKNDFVKNNTDVAQNNSKKSDNSKSFSFKNSFSDFEKYSVAINISDLTSLIRQSTNFKAGNIISFPHISPEQPPEAC